MRAYHALLLHFVEVMTTDIFRNELTALALKTRYYLEWVIRVDIRATSSIYRNTKKHTVTSFKPLEKLLFARRTDVVLKEVETEKF